MKEDDLKQKTNIDGILLTLDLKFYQLSKPEIEFHVMEEMYAALCMCTCAKKTTFLGKDD